ncbi:MAG: type II toxin-antitoxin system HigA family antitoxin [Pyrinomonadaceae bacterium]
MTANFDKKKYGMLLMEHIPAVITNDDELDLMTEEIDRLMSKGIGEAALSPEEESLLELLTVLVESYEDEHYPIPEASPTDMLKYFMEDREIKQSDLLPVFGSSGITSEVVNGKRSISKAHARKLAEFFKVSVELFI